MRAALARLLLQGPALLLLDEPTNHLDLESLGWLENYLSAYDGTVVVVSHDRYFLNRMVTTVARALGDRARPLSGGLRRLPRPARGAAGAPRGRASNQAKRVAEIERFVERFRYKATKARQVQSRIKMLDRLDRVEVEGAARHDPLLVPRAAPDRSARRPAAAHRQGLWPEGRLRGDRSRPRARRARRARRAERRREVDAPPDPRGRARPGRGRAGPRGPRRRRTTTPSTSSTRSTPRARSSRRWKPPRPRPTARASGRSSARSSSRATPWRSASPSSREARRRGSRSRGCSSARRPSSVSTSRRTTWTSRPGTSSRTRSRASPERWSSSRTTATSSIAWRRRSSRSGTAAS